MNIKRYPSSEAFLNAVEPFLSKEIHLNNLMLGLLHRLKREGSNEDDLFLHIQDGALKLVVMMSGLYVIVYANATDERLYETLIDYLDVHHIDYPGVIGPVFYADAFKAAFEAKTNKPMHTAMKQRIFVIKNVIHDSTLDASIRVVRAEDNQLIKQWMKGFLDDIQEAYTPQSIDERIKRLIENQGLYVLVHDDQLVSMAAGIRPMGEGISIGYVYTPPQLRNKGFATACVQKLSAHYLKAYDYCTLYTDLANPTSNSIYQKIGYRAVGDSVVYRKPSA